jgi:hypothetical protein
MALTQPSPATRSAQNHSTRPRAKLARMGEPGMPASVSRSNCGERSPPVQKREIAPRRHARSSPRHGEDRFERPPDGITPRTVTSSTDPPLLVCQVALRLKHAISGRRIPITPSQPGHFDVDVCSCGSLPSRGIHRGSSVNLKCQDDVPPRARSAAFVDEGSGRP